MTDLGEMEKYRMPSDPHNLVGKCWCGVTSHYDMATQSAIDYLTCLKLHRKIEDRINEEAVTLNFDRFGLNGEIYEWLKKDTVLKIIEEEFGRLGNI